MRLRSKSIKIALLVSNLLASPLMPASKKESSGGAPLVRFTFVPGTSLVVIPVFVNERGPYRFLLDTGASNSSKEHNTSINSPCECCFYSGHEMRKEGRDKTICNVQTKIMEWWAYSASRNS